MTKTLSLIVSLAFLVAFNIIFFFATGSDHSAPVWTCYAFLHIACIATLVVPVVEAKGKTAYESKLTSLSIAYAYYAVEFVLMLAVLAYEMLIDKEFGNIVVLPLQVIVTVACVVILASNLLMNDTIAKKQAVHDAQNSFIKTISSTLKYIESIAADQKLKDKINDVYTIAHTSPIKTSESVKVQEDEIVGLLSEVEGKVEAKDDAATLELLEKVVKLLNKRNFVLKAQH